MLQKIKDGYQYGLGLALAMLTVSTVVGLLSMLLSVLMMHSARPM